LASPTSSLSGYGILPSIELILELDFGTKQLKKDVKRDMIGV